MILLTLHNSITIYKLKVNFEYKSVSSERITKNFEKDNLTIKRITLEFYVRTKNRLRDRKLNILKKTSPTNDSPLHYPRLLKTIA